MLSYSSRFEITEMPPFAWRHDAHETPRHPYPRPAPPPPGLSCACRRDGWNVARSPVRGTGEHRSERQIAFIEALVESACVEEACRRAVMSRSTASPRVRARVGSLHSLRFAPSHRASLVRLVWMEQATQTRRRPEPPPEQREERAQAGRHARFAGTRLTSRIHSVTAPQPLLAGTNRSSFRRQQLGATPAAGIWSALRSSRGGLYA